MSNFTSLDQSHQCLLHAQAIPFAFFGPAVCRALGPQKNTTFENGWGGPPPTPFSAARHSQIPGALTMPRNFGARKMIHGLARKAARGSIGRIRTFVPAPSASTSGAKDHPLARWNRERPRQSVRPESQQIPLRATLIKPKLWRCGKQKLNRRREKAVSQTERMTASFESGSLFADLPRRTAGFCPTQKFPRPNALMRAPASIGFTVAPASSFVLPT